MTGSYGFWGFEQINELKSKMHSNKSLLGLFTLYFLLRIIQLILGWNLSINEKMVKMPIRSDESNSCARISPVI